MSNPEGVLVVAPNWLGDAVMALPALADVRRAHAQARLIVAARRSIGAPPARGVDFPPSGRRAAAHWMTVAFASSTRIASSTASTVPRRVLTTRIFTGIQRRLGASQT